MKMSDSREVAVSVAERPEAGGGEPREAPLGFDVSVAHPARVYDYWLGGKENFEPDRIAAEEVIAVRPTIIRDIRANREFLGRVVRYLAGEAGVRQFLDIGTGIPSANNTHEVAQSVAPDARIVYVDNDPIVLAHARALLASTPQGACAYLDADLKDTGKILKEAARTLDFSRPVAVLFIGVLHLVSDKDDPVRIMGDMLDATVPGSYLALTQPAGDINADQVAEGARRYNERVRVPQTRRSYAETLRFFDGMEVVSPGLVQCHRWRPAPGAVGLDENVSAYGGLARKR
jgi:S-adenosyl methyltransferase